MTENSIVAPAFYLAYVCLACLTSSMFYTRLLTPRKWLRYPKQICYFSSLILTATTMFIFFNNDLAMSFGYLANLTLPVFLFFQEKLMVKIICGLLSMLCCAFAEMVCFFMLSVLNIFMPQKDLVPRHLLASGDVFWSLFILITIVFGYALLLRLLEKRLVRLLPFFEPRITLFLAFPLVASIFNCGLMSLLHTHFDLLMYTPLMLFIGVLVFLSMRKGFEALKRQEALLLHIKDQEGAILRRLDHYKNIETEFTLLRKWRHDILNHLTVLNFLLESENFEEAQNYLEKLL